MPYGVFSGISILKVSLSPILTVSTSFDWLSKMRILKVVFGKIESGNHGKQRYTELEFLKSLWGLGTEEE